MFILNRFIAVFLFLGFLSACTSTGYRQTKPTTLNSNVFNNILSNENKFKADNINLIKLITIYGEELLPKYNEINKSISNMTGNILSSAFTFSGSSKRDEKKIKEAIAVNIKWLLKTKEYEEDLQNDDNEEIKRSRLLFTQSIFNLSDAFRKLFDISKNLNDGGLTWNYDVLTPKNRTAFNNHNKECEKKINNFKIAFEEYLIILTGKKF